MIDSLKIKALAPLGLFIFLMLGATYVFAKTTTGICLNNTSIPMHTRDNLNVTHGTLKKGTKIQLPKVFTQNIRRYLDANGEIDIYKMRMAWHRLEQTNPLLKRPEYRTRQGKKVLLYPVKIVSTPSFSLGSNPKDQFGYIPLEELLKPWTFSTCNLKRKETPQSSKRPKIRPILNSNPEEEQQEEPHFFEVPLDGETTSQEVGIPSSLRPTLRPRGAAWDKKVKEDEEKETRTYTQPTTVMNPHNNARCENIRTKVAAALGSAAESKRVNCYLDLFHKETGCRHKLSQKKGNAGNPHAGYGLCSLEASLAVRKANRRGPECMVIKTVEQQTKCCASIMAKI